MNNVVMLVNEFPPISGGSEKQAERLATYMAAQGRAVWVITRHFPGLARREERNGFLILRPASFGLGKMKTITFILGALVSLWQLRKEYTVLHAHMLFGAAFAGVLAGRVLNKRVVVKLGSSGPSGEVAVSSRTWRGRIRLAALRKWVDKIIVLDKKMEAEALSLGIEPAKVQLISNGIDAAVFRVSSELARPENFPPDKVIVLFVGRFVPEKSLPTLIEAFAKAIQLSPQLHLMLVGDGTERAMLETLVEKLEIQKDVTFAGKQTDVRSYLAYADMFVLPSKTEGMSNALLEGMSAGLPCLATPVGAARQMLAEGRAGLLLPVGDVDVWAQALSGLADDPTRRASLGQAAYRRVMEAYDFSIIGKRYENLYDALVIQEKSLAGQG